MAQSIKKQSLIRAEFEAELCRRDFYYFIQRFWDTVVPDPPVWNWHISYLADQVAELVECILRREAAQDLIVNIPPGTSKSTIISVMLPAWAWTRDPSLRILTASYAASLSTDLSVKSRDVIRSALYRELFPQVEIKDDQDNKTHYKTTSGGERMATSTTGSVTGFHADLILVDDPLNAQMSLSEAKRLEAQRFLDTTLSTRKTDKAISRTVLIMQRLSEADPTGVWLRDRQDQVRHICIPGELTGDVKPPELQENYQEGLLDPVRFSRETLEQLRIQLGSYGYAGQILQSPVPLKDLIWDPSWFIVIPDAEIPQGLTYLGTDWDLAYTAKDTNSASAYVTAGKLGTKMYITGAGAVFKEFPELVRFMAALPGPHYVENKASGKSAVQTLKSRGIPAKEVQVPAGDKVARATLASPYAEAGQVFLAASVAEYLLFDPFQGVAKFPNAPKDDLADALAQAISRLLNKPKVVVF